MGKGPTAPFSRVDAYSELAAGTASYPDACDREFLTIGEMVREFDVTARALRFYEAKGLLTPRRQGPVRFYGRTDRERLAQVQKAKKLGFTLFEIHQMMDAASRPAESGALNISRRQCFEQIKLLEQRKREIEAALAELRRTYSSFYAQIASGSF